MVWVTWLSDGGWEERKLKGRLEPGTSVVNGSILDNISRGWWWGGQREGWRLPGSKGGCLVVLNVSVDDEKAGRFEKKNKNELGDISPVSHTVGPTIPPTKPH